MIVLPDKVNVAQMDRMEEGFKLKGLPFAWWVDENNLSSEMLERFQNGKYADFGDVPGMVYELIPIVTINMVYLSLNLPILSIKNPS